MKLTVLGPGCWGLTLAWLLTDNFEEVCVWGRTSDLNEDLIKNKHCSKPLEVQLADKVEITDDLKYAISGADIILSVVATGGVRPVCEQLKEAGIKENQVIVNASKGIELNTLMRMSEVIKDVLPNQKLAIQHWQKKCLWENLQQHLWLVKTLKLRSLCKKLAMSLINLDYILTQMLLV